MNKNYKVLLFLLFLAPLPGLRAQTPIGKPAGLKVQVANGLLEGQLDPLTGIRYFLGIPYAQAPIGKLRWRAPQPALNWSGIRKADRFGPKAVQKPLFFDIRFRTDTMSEDCLYLNVWAPERIPAKKLPVLVYYFGGGYVNGDGSEGRYDGESLARKGIVTVTVNYRLGIFGFFSYPGMGAESSHHIAGNFGLLDQAAALKWVHDNIAAFGGDPDRITIAGESAGSLSVSALMASPLTRDLIHGAIGESGAMFRPDFAPVSATTAEAQGKAFAEKFGIPSLAGLRALPASELLADASKPGAYQTRIILDGYLLPQSPQRIFEAGKQARIPLLVGWNSTEIPYLALMRGQLPNPGNYAGVLKQLYGDQASQALKWFPGSSQSEVIRSATTLASDRFIVFSTWKWSELQRLYGGHPVWRYLFSRARPANVDTSIHPNFGKMPPPLNGAVHSGEIEYALGNLVSNPVYAWNPEDYLVSRTMENYFANFIRTGNPNGTGLPHWIPNGPKVPVHFMDIDVHSRPEVQSRTQEGQFDFLDKEFHGK